MPQIQQVIDSIGKTKSNPFNDLLINTLKLEAVLNRHGNISEEIIAQLSETIYYAIYMYGFHNFKVDDDEGNVEEFKNNIKNILKKDTKAYIDKYLRNCRLNLFDIHELAHPKLKESDHEQLKGKSSDIIKNLFLLTSFLSYNIDMVIDYKLKKDVDEESPIHEVPNDIKKHKRTNKNSE